MDINERINALTTELEEVQDEWSTTTDATRYKALSERIRAITAELDTLNDMQTAEDTTEAEPEPVKPVKPITRAEAIAFINQRNRERTAKLDTIRKQISTAKGKHAEAERIYKACISAGDIDGATNARREAQTQQDTAEHLTAVLASVEAMPTISTAEINKAWAEIISGQAHVWVEHIAHVAETAKAYRDALEAMREYHNTVKDIREDFRRTAKANGGYLDDKGGTFAYMLDDLRPLKVRDHETAWLVGVGMVDPL